MLPGFIRRYLGLTIGLAAVIALLVVIFLDDQPRAQTVSLGYAPLTTITPAPVAAADPLPGGASPRSALVMIQGEVERRLSIWPLATGGDPVEVDRYVTLWPLLPDPTGTRVLYCTQHTVMVLDTESRRAHIVGDLPDEGVVVAAQWSPDGDAVAYVAETPDYEISYYTLADGLQSARLMLRTTRGLPLDVGWLPDGRPASIFLGVGAAGGLEAFYQLYDPATGDQVLLPNDTRVIQPWTPWRAPGGDYQLYPLSTWGDTRRGPCKTGALSLTGDEWIQLTLSGAHYKEQQIAFEIKSVFLDQATWLSDGRILMRGMADEACSPTGAGLYVAYLSGQPRQIVQTASPYTSDDPKALLWGVAFAVSPDESLVAWAENDTAAARSTIHLTPIDDGEASTLLAITPPENGAPFDYQDNHLILAFIWLP